MKANIITIGDEILIGQITDTNSSWIAQELTKIGVNVNKLISISDKKDDIQITLKNSLNESDLIIFTGGLGSTNDDITKKTLAEFFNSKLIQSSDVLNNIAYVLNKRGNKLNNLNKQQALIPDKAEILPNKQGTAPALMFKTENNKMIISLPGVPKEMKGIMTQYGFNAITNFFTLPSNLYKTINTCGIPESELAEMLQNWENNLPENINLAYLPSPGIVRLRLGTKGNSSKKELEEYLAPYIQQLYKMIPNNIFSEDTIKIQEAVGNILHKKKLTVSTAESCTGGNVAKLITSVAGCSNWYRGTIVAYSNQIKQNILKISETTLNQYGAVSKECVSEMATKCCQLFNTNCSIAISGIAGPTGGSAEKPVGTIWVCINCCGNLKIEHFKLGNDRKLNIEKISILALNMLYNQLKHI